MGFRRELERRIKVGGNTALTFEDVILSGFRRDRRGNQKYFNSCL